MLSRHFKELIGPVFYVYFLLAVAIFFIWCFRSFNDGIRESRSEFRDCDFKSRISRVNLSYRLGCWKGEPVYEK